MTKKRFTAAVLAGILAVSSITGCNLMDTQSTTADDSDDETKEKTQPATDEPESKTQEGGEPDTKEPGTEDISTPEVPSDEETPTAEPVTDEPTTPEETTPEETTPENPGPGPGPEVGIDDGSLAAKYFALMQLSVEDARKEFGVEEDKSLKAEDFDKYLYDLFVDSVSGSYLSMIEYVDDPASFDIDVDSLDFTWGHTYTTAEDLKEGKDEVKSYIEELLAYPIDGLSNRQKLVYDKYYYELILSMWGYDVMPFSNYLNPRDDVLSNIGIRLYEVVFDEKKDVEYYFECLKTLPDFIEELPEGIQYQIDNYGYAPDESMLESHRDILVQLCDDTDENVLIAGFDAKIDAMDISADDAKKYKEENAKIVREEIIPALKAYDKELDGITGITDAVAPMCSYKGGRDYYDYLIEAEMSCGMSVQELLDYLKAEVDDCENELISIAQKDMDAYYAYVDGDFEYPATEADEIVKYLLEKMGPNYPELGNIDWKVAYLPKVLEQDGILAYYITPLLDNDKLNVIRVNGGANDTGLFGTMAHEGFPGHMLQFNIQKRAGSYYVENTFTELGYSEGWAMLVDRDAVNYAGFNKNLARIIQLDDIIGYDIEAILDLGINGLGWGADEVYDFLSGDLGYSYSKEDCEGIIMELAPYPGNLISYAAGYHLVDETIKGYMEENDVTYKEACEAFLEIGNAAFHIVAKYMGTDFTK
ncbi:MAG: DUF885 family protein [Lachnospiraceae bacterium]|nr:DUF885 family protein [Lachnospiraceae bacterium]